MFKLMTLALIPALIPALVTAAPTTDTKHVGEFIFPSSSDELERGNSYKVKWNVTDDTVLETYDYAQLFFGA